MNINQSEFCSLSTAPAFLTWLYRNSTELHTSLVTHLKQSLGCKANRDKMIELLGIMQKDADLIAKLSDFIQEKYPQLITDNKQPKAAVKPVQPVDKKLNKHGVFTHYDPNLTSYPRRKILEYHKGSNLERDVLNYCIRHAYCEHIIIDDVAYIEYLEMQHIRFKDKIPAKNWEIRTYKAANGLK